ncbi:MAG: hypothetical protein U0V74_01420 [Chitinophagales bacterium]
MNTTNKLYRPGPLGALMDEYCKVAEEYKALLLSLSQEDFTRVIDPETQDPSCTTVQKISTHVVFCGYNYSNYIRKQFGDEVTIPKPVLSFSNAQEVVKGIDDMLNYQEECLKNKWDITWQQTLDNIMKVSWGQAFDIEQILEHAIVHIMRHRRQIERLLGL